MEFLIQLLEPFKYLSDWRQNQGHFSYCNPLLLPTFYNLSLKPFSWNPVFVIVSESDLVCLENYWIFFVFLSPSCIICVARSPSFEVRFIRSFWMFRHSDIHDFFRILKVFNDHEVEISSPLILHGNISISEVSCSIQRIIHVTWKCFPIWVHFEVNFRIILELSTNLFSLFKHINYILDLIDLSIWKFWKSRFFTVNLEWCFLF